MERNIVWTGIDNLSIEKCVLIDKGETIHSKGELVGNKNNQVYGAEYQVVVDQKWETRFFDISCKVGHKNYAIHGYKLNNQWIIDEQEHPELHDCLDIDISVTPFTNALPINRLRLEIGESKELAVLYINPIEERFSRVVQRYERLSATTYHYKNLWSDFESTIEVDSEGLVTTYPKLFNRL